jgi:hypothetical protein
MRCNGVAKEFVTDNAKPEEKFNAWAVEAIHAAQSVLPLDAIGAEALLRNHRFVE